MLYSFRRCPYAMRARMALAVGGHDPELREVRLRNKPAAMLDASPRGTVPVLVTDGGEVIDESLDIMDWAVVDHHRTPGAFADRRGDPALSALVVANDGPFKAALDRYKYPPRFPPEQCKGARERALQIVSELAPFLTTSPFLDGGSPGFHDAAIFPFVRQFSMVEPPWFRASVPPSVWRWREAMLGEPLFVQVMAARLVPWQPGDAPVSFQQSLTD